ncbi:MAG: hypothetical protein ACTSR8_01740 [Promethearchaeota archaeon]
MRKKVFVLTENLNFFYRINEELKARNVKFKILNYNCNKIPDLPSVIITTEAELERLPPYNKHNATILPLTKEQNIKDYIITLLAAYKIGYKEYYSEMLFSIDPGTKHLGMVVFLEDFFFLSYTFFNQESLVESIKSLVKIFKANIQENFLLEFKFGSGLLTIAIQIMQKLFCFFSGRRNVKFSLVDERKTSKIRIPEKFPKHEASALIIALREGIEINPSDPKGISYQMKLKNFKKEKSFNNLIEEKEEQTSHLTLGDIVKKVLFDEIGLSHTIKIIKENKIQV